MNPIGPFSISNLPSVKFEGVWRVLGCIPETSQSKARFSRFGDSVKTLDQSQWQEIDLQWYNPPILDQGMTSSCTGHACCSGMEMCWLQSGRALVEFNPYFVYGLVNGGRDAGAMISDCLSALQQYGICEKDQLPSGVMFQSQFPPAAFQNAARRKLIKAYHCATFEEICSAISLGFVCPLGIYVGQNFPNLDANGVAPLPGGGGGGHAILGMGLKKSSQYGWLIKIQNSWGCYDKETEVLTSEGWKLFPKIEGHELIATLNPDTYNIEYQEIEQVHAYSYSGNLRQFKARDVDIVVTPNHNMFIKTLHDYKNNKEWRLVRADECKQHLYMKKDGSWVGSEVEYYKIGDKKIPMDLWLEFLGYFLSEGYTTSSTYQVKEWKGKRRTYIKGVRRRNNQGQFEFVDKETDVLIVRDRVEKERLQTNYISGICQDKECNLPVIGSCLEKMPFKFAKREHGWTTNNKALYEELKVFGKAPQKYIPSYVRSLSARQQTILYKALMLGDGTEYTNCSRRTYYTSSKRLADDVQELVLKIGYCGDITITDRVGEEYKSGVRREIEYKVGIKHKQLEQHHKYDVIEIPYCDNVYCVTVPNHIIYVRRNGRAVWCGNSNFGMHGYCYIHRGHFNMMSPDAFAIQSISDDPQNPDNIPVVTG